MTSLTGDANAPSVSSLSATVPMTTADSGTVPAVTEERKHPTTALLDSGPVQAYAKLEGEDFCYYIRTLQVTLGRKVTKPDNVDIALGTMKSVSRHHARLFYNFTTQRFEFMVFGKNGAFVNEQFIEKGVTVALENRTKIQIGDVSFVFLLPRMDPEETSSRNEPTACVCKPHQLQRPASRSAQERESTHDTADSSAQEGPDTIEVYDEDTKPPYSYATLIAQAINSTEDKRMTLSGIYLHIHERYPYFKMENTGWQNSIRHNLSLNKAFVRVPRRGTEHGKGSYWTIDPEAESQFPNGIYKPSKRLMSRNSSNCCTGNENSEAARKRVRREESEDDASKRQAKSAASTTTTETTITQQQSGAADATATTLKPTDGSPPTTTPMTSPSTPSPSNGTPTATTTSTNTTPQQQQQQQQQNAQNTTSAQAQMQLQLQNTIRQHLLDPVRYPLPPNIAQLLPQAIAQLPPHLASQLTATLQAALRAHSNNNSNAANKADQQQASSSETKPSSSSTAEGAETVSSSADQAESTYASAATATETTAVPDKSTIDSIASSSPQSAESTTEPSTVPDTASSMQTSLPAPSDSK